MRQVLLPTTLDQLWDLLENLPDRAVYAGGTDLLVKIREGHLDPANLICLERLESLQEILEQDEEVFVGSATTHATLIEDETIRENFPVLAKAASVLGSPPIRHMGTVGGNIVTASPAGDTLPALYVLSADVEVLSATHSRRTPIREFILAPGSVDLTDGEIVAGVWLKKNRSWNISHYEKIGRRKAQACAIASMAALLDLSDDGTVNGARLAWGSVGLCVVTSEEVENQLIGNKLTIDRLKKAANLLDKAISPIDDIRASAEYRRMIAKSLLSRLSNCYPFVS